MAVPWAAGGQWQTLIQLITRRGSHSQGTHGRDSQEKSPPATPRPAAPAPPPLSVSAADPRPRPCPKRSQVRGAGDDQEKQGAGNDKLEQGLTGWGRGDRPWQSTSPRSPCHPCLSPSWFLLSCSSFCHVIVPWHVGLRHHPLCLWFLTTKGS